MPENGIEETQETPEHQNTVSAPEDNEAIKALLSESKDQEEEQKGAAAAAEKDARIAALEAALSEAKQSAESLRAEGVAISSELASVKQAKDQAIAKYLAMAKALNPGIMENMIAGETIEEIDASVEKAKAIVGSVRKSLEAEAAAVKVPAGAPSRGGISLEGLSPREKIAAGITSLRGTQ